MTCKNCNIKPVWEFTNQTKLCKNCFIDYIEKKVFRTIRQGKMLSGGREVLVKKNDSLNYSVLKEILEKKFAVSNGDGLLSENLSEIAEIAFENVLNGDFSCLSMDKRPLYWISDKEIELYAKLKGIKGKARKRDEKIRQLFEKFTGKNPDLEINVVKAIEQLKDE